MAYQRRVLILNLTLFLLGMVATVGCRAEGAAAPRAVSDSQNATLIPCSVDFPSCLSAILPPHTTALNTGGQTSIKIRPSLLASGKSGANPGWQSSHESASGRNINSSGVSAGADTDTNKGRLAFNVTLDSYYHGAIYNSQAPFEPMQVSLNYIRPW